MLYLLNHVIEVIGYQIPSFFFEVRELSGGTQGIADGQPQKASHSSFHFEVKSKQVWLNFFRNGIDPFENGGKFLPVRITWLNNAKSVVERVAQFIFYVGVKVCLHFLQYFVP